jgi:hypothetical protein
MVLSPTRVSEDVRQLLALEALRDTIAPSDLPISLHYYRPGDIALLDVLDARITGIRGEIAAKRVRRASAAPKSNVQKMHIAPDDASAAPGEVG